MATKKPLPAYLRSSEDLNYDALDQFLGTLNQAQPEPELGSRGALRGMGDVALSAGRGAVQGVRMLSDLGGSDNAVSKGLRSVEDYIGSLRSAQAQQDDQQVAAILKSAEGAGILDQVVAGAKAFAVAPVSTLAQAVGTSIPTLAAAAIPGVGPAAVAGRMGAALSIGAGQGAGSVKGQIYDTVKDELRQAGASPEEAERRALEASSYEQSGGKIATGAALGALAGTTGAERAVGAMLRGSPGAAQGMARRVVQGAVTEGIPEALQGGQEKLAGNQALYEQGFERDPMSGVVAAGTMEALAGAGMGAIAGLPSPAQRPGDQLRAEGLQPEIGPFTRSSNKVVEAAANVLDNATTALGATPPKPLVGNEIDYTPEPITGNLAIGDAQEIARQNIAKFAARHEPIAQADAQAMVARAEAEGKPMVAVPHPEGGGFTVVPRQWVTAAMANPSPQAGPPPQVQAAINAADDLQLEGEAPRMAKAARTPRTPRAQPAPDAPQADLVATYVDQRRNDGTPAGRAFAQDFDAGRITRADVQGLIDTARPQSADDRLAAAAAQAPKPQALQPGDILNPKGEPFRNQRAATTVAQREGGSVIVVDGGWAVRKREADGQPRGDEGTGTAERGAVSGDRSVVQQPADQRGSAGNAAPAVGGAEPGDGAAVVRPGEAGPAAELTGGGFIPAPNGYKVRVSRHQRGSNVLDPKADIGAFVYEVRKGDGDLNPLTMVVNKDGKLVAAGTVLTGNTSNGQAWVPKSQAAADAVQSLLEQRAGTKVGSDERKAIDAKIAEAVAADQAGPPGDKGSPELTADTDLPTLKKAWSEAAAAGDTERAREINDRIVAKKKAPGTAVAAPSGAVVPAGLSVTFGGKTYPVESVEDAQRKWIKFQESAADGGPAGVSQVGNGIPVNDGAGRLVARVAYNGRAFDPQDNLIAEAPAAPKAAKVESDSNSVTSGNTGGASSTDRAPVKQAERKSLQESRTDAALDKEVSEGGERMTRRQWVERKVAEGLKTRIEQEDRIKPMSRMQFFRANNEEQRAHERKIKEAGKKDVYWIGDYEVTKTEHDYAVGLMSAPQGESAPVKGSKKAAEIKAKRAAKNPAPAAPESAAATTEGAANGDQAQEEAQGLLSTSAPADVTTAGAAEGPIKRPPKSFRKKVKVKTDVFVEETGSFEQREIDAEAAMTALDEDIKGLLSLRACIAGGVRHAGR